MKKQVKYRSDGTRTIVGGRGVNPKLGSKLLADGMEALYLEYYMGYERTDDGRVKVERRREYLKGMRLNATPTTAIEREVNRQVLDEAKIIRDKAAVKNGETSREAIRERLAARDVKAADYLNDYMKTRTTRQRIVKAAITSLMHYLAEKKQEGIKLGSLTTRMMEEWVDDMKNVYNGSTPHDYMQIIRQALARAVDDGILRRNVTDGVKTRTDTTTIRKEILTLDEVEKLAATHYPHENDIIRRAFLFTCLTGVRLVDVRALTYSCIDEAARTLRFEQRKTAGHSRHAGVMIPLNATTMTLVGTIGEPTARIFPLPVWDTCAEHLARWMAAAGIHKHITWHCGRHSFAVNVLARGADIQTAASLLGHSSVMMTTRYLHVVDALKKKATDSLMIDLDEKGGDR